VRNESSRGSAIIVGGSLTGLAAAIALARTGVRVTVLEQTLRFDRGGTGLGVDRGLLAAVVGVDPRTDRDQPHLPVIVTSRETSTWQAIRAWLGVLAARVDGLEIREGVRVTSVAQTPDSATAVAGDETFTADVVIGADGYRSTVRAAVDPHNAFAPYAGFLIWRGLVSERALPAHASRARMIGGLLPSPQVARLIAYHVPGADGSVQIGEREFTFAWYDASRTAWLRGNGALSGDEVRHSIEGASIDDRLRDRLRMAAREAWSGIARDIVLNAIDERIIFGTPLTEYYPQRLVNGRLAILGDAGHVASPMVGHGLALGWLDAHALAAAIAAEDKPNEQALAAYERARLNESQMHVKESQRSTRELLLHAQRG
jgi:2-polyprenyl-6-methoxyphenol hydroxylase-like FAD-dependent oxidoreductase